MPFPFSQQHGTYFKSKTNNNFNKKREQEKYFSILNKSKKIKQKKIEEEKKKNFIILFENKLFTYDMLITCLQVSDKSYYFCPHSLYLYIYMCLYLYLYSCVCMDLKKSSHNNLQKAHKKKQENKLN